MKGEAAFNAAKVTFIKADNNIYMNLETLVTWITKVFNGS